MNRILFESCEINEGVATFSDVRAEHVLDVLHGEVGQILKTGEVNGLIGTSEIAEIIEYPNNRIAERRDADKTVKGDATFVSREIKVKVHHTQPSLAPWVDLILAPPRPRVMKRLLPQLATMGVGRIFLVGAKKVEKDFWGATLLKEENYRPLLVEGLMQGGTSILPTLETRRNFRRFVTDELDALFPTTRRIVAHPYVDAAACRACKEESNSIRRGEPPRQHRLLLAIGPEGGWTDEEVALLETHGFARYSLGSRILRTDTATIALLAKLNDE